MVRLAFVMGKLRHGGRSTPWILQQSQEANPGPSHWKIHLFLLHPLQIFDLQCSLLGIYTLCSHGIHRSYCMLQDSVLAVSWQIFLPESWSC